jgi:MYXO-CTERM domain-containing protein
MIPGRACRALARRKGALCAFTYIALHVSVAHAGHEPLLPEPRTILLREGHREHIVVGTRRGGYFVTRDAGASWSWLCEAGVGYDDEEVYPGALLPSGKLVVSTGFGGLAVSADGCGWSPWLPSAQPFMADVRVRSDIHGAVVALEGRGESEGFVNQLWQSTDDAETWQPLGTAFAPDTQAVSVTVSDTGELYVGAVGPTGAELLRSEDAVSWTRTTISSESGVTPRLIGASAGAGSARLYVLADYAQAEGLTTPGDRALISRDRGQSFTLLFEGVGDLAAWALSPDGERLAIGGHSDGLHVLTDARDAVEGTLMARVSSKPAHVLNWDAEGRLYVAGHEAIDGFSVGASSDAGETFSPLFALCQVTGPLACPEETTVGGLCRSSGETGWDVRKEVADSSACTNGTLPAGVGGSASPASGASDPTASGAGTPASASGDETSTSAASCSAAPVGRGTGHAVMVLALAALPILLRRRRKSPMRARSHPACGGFHDPPTCRKCDGIF